MEISYLGRFSADQIQPILEAAAPIPVDPFDERGDDGSVRSTTRDEAIVRRLEWLDTLTQMNIQHQSDISPSDLKKRARAVASAAKTLLKTLGVGTDGTLEVIQRQLRNGLQSAAERYGAERGGFAHYPPTLWHMAGEDFTDFHGDSQLRDNIEAIKQLRAWAEQVSAVARQRVGAKATAVRFAERMGIEPWDGDPITDALAGVLRIWVEILRRDIRTAVNSDGFAYGPLIDFTLACLRALSIDTADPPKPLAGDAIRSRINRMVARGFLKSPGGH